MSFQINEPVTNAVIWTPTSPPWAVGNIDPLAEVNFYSTIGHLAIEVDQPSTMDDGEFYNLVGQINPMLDTLLPGWVTWDWARTLAAHSVSILSSTFASPLAVTTSSPHGFTAGQYVKISGHLLNTAANSTGINILSIISATEFDIAVAGIAIGGATGTVTDDLTPTYPLHHTNFYLDGTATISGTLVNLDNLFLTDGVSV